MKKQFVLTVLALSFLLVPHALAHHGACHWPVGANWTYLSTDGANLRTVSRYDYAPGPYGSALASRYNDTNKTIYGITLTTELQKTSSWSANLKSVFGKTDSTQKEVIKATVDIGPYRTAQLVARTRKWMKTYSYDMLCRFQNRLTGEIRLTVHSQGHTGSEIYAWPEYTVVYR